MASSGSGGVSGPDYGRVRNELAGIATEFIGIAAAVNELRSTIRVFRDLEAQLSLTNAVLSGTAETYARLEIASRRFALGASFSANEVASSFYFLASAGFSVEEAMAAANGVLLLAQGNLANIAEVSDIVASNIRAFGLEAYETGRLANTMAAAVANSQATLQKLGFAFRQVGPIASQAGLSFEQATASLGVLFDVGLRGEQAGTALRNVITRLQAPTGETAELLEALNVQVFDASGNFKDFYGILSELADAGLSDGDLAIIAGTEALAGFNALLQSTRASGGDIARIQELTDKITGTNQAYIQSTAILETLDGALKLAANSMDELRLIVGTAVAPVLTDVLYQFVDVVAGIQNMDRAAQLNGVSMGLWAVGAIALVRQLTNLEEFVVRGMNASKAWADAQERLRLVNASSLQVFTTTGKTVEQLGGRFGLAARSVAGFGTAIGNTINAIAGPLGAIAILGGLAYAIYQTDKAAREAEFDVNYGDYDSLYDKFARRGRLAELQFQYDAETGAGVSAYIAAQNTIVQDIQKELVQSEAELKRLNEIDKPRAAEIKKFLDGFKDLDKTLSQNFVLSDSKVPVLEDLQNIAKQMRGLEQAGQSVEVQAEAFLLGLDSMSERLRKVGAANVYGGADNSVIISSLDFTRRDIESMREGFISLDEESKALVLQALSGSADATGRELVEILSGEKGALSAYTVGAKMFDERIKKITEDTAATQSLLAEGRRAVEAALPLLETNVKELIGVQAQNDHRVMLLLDAYFTDRDRLAQTLAPSLERGEDPLNALLIDVYAYLNDLTDIPALRQGAEYRTTTPLLRDEFVTLDAALRKSMIDIALEAAKGAANPEAQLDADLSALREQYRQNADGIGDRIVRIYTEEIVKAGEEFSRVDSNIEDMLRTGFNPVAGSTAATSDPGELQFYISSVLETYIASRLASGAPTREAVTGDRSYPEFERLVRKQAQQVSDAYTLLQLQQANTIREALEAQQERRFNARLPDASEFDNIIGGYRVQQFEALRKYLLSPGLEQDTEIRQLEEAFNKRNAVLRSKYGALFQKHVVYDTRQAFDSALMDAFSGVGVGDFNFNDRANSPADYAAAALEALEASLPSDVEDRAQRISNAELFLQQFVQEIGYETSITAETMKGLFEEKTRQIERFKVDVKNYIGANATAIAELQSVISVRSGGTATTVGGLVANERSLSDMAEFDARISDITEQYEEYIRKAQDDKDLQATLTAQRDDLIAKTQELRRIEEEWQASSEGRMSALVEGQQRVIDEFVNAHQLTGTIMQGINAELAQMLLEAPTNFEVGQEIARQGIEGTASMLSGLIVGIDTEWEQALSNMLANMAQFVSQAIIQALLLRAVMAIPGVGGFLQPIGALPGLGGNLGGHGNAGSGGNPISFSAKGDAFNNGYMLNTPSLYSHSSGMGMAGEMGTEAIMPLTRGRNGKLGVYAEGGGDGNVVIQSTLNLNLTMTQAPGSGAEEQAQMIGKFIQDSMDARDTALLEKLGRRGDIKTGGPF